MGIMVYLGKVVVVCEVVLGYLIGFVGMFEFVVVEVVDDWK